MIDFTVDPRLFRLHSQPSEYLNTWRLVKGGMIYDK